MITHDLGVVAGLCDVVNVMYSGRIVEKASRGALFGTPRHPYTGGLLGSIPRLDSPRGVALTPIPGSPTNTLPWSQGCAFSPRCGNVTDECTTSTPELRAHTDRELRCFTPSSADPGRRWHMPARRETPMSTLVSIEDLKVHFPITEGLLLGRSVGSVKAVDGVDLKIEEGKTLGLVGESGCGKSTLGKAVLRLAPMTSGRVLFEGDDVASLKGEKLRAKRQDMQMVFQDPLASLNPRQSVETLLTEPLRAHGISYGKNRVQELLDQVGLPTTASHRYPHEFSGGQRQRIGIARALALEPRFIIADEPVSALDVSIQAQVLNLLEELQERLHLTYLVIAHDLAVVRHVSDDVAVMYLGGIVEQSGSDALYEEPLHPYTKALMSAVPVPDPVVEATRERIILQGDLPSPADPPTGCRFHTRCPFRQETRCDTERPELRDHGDGHLVACHFVEEIRRGDIRPRGHRPGPRGLTPSDRLVGVLGRQAGVGDLLPVDHGQRWRGPPELGAQRLVGAPRAQRGAVGAPVAVLRRPGDGLPDRLDLALDGEQVALLGRCSAAPRRCRGRSAGAPSGSPRSSASRPGRRTSSGTAPWPRRPRPGSGRCCAWARNRHRTDTASRRRRPRCTGLARTRRARPS